MRTQFDYKKTLQACAYLLKKADVPMEYLKLLKLLYLAERQMLLQYGLPITCDRYCAMKNGPVLSQTYDIIKGNKKDEYSDWDNYIQRLEDYSLTLVREPGDDDLSIAETDILDEIYDTYGNMDVWAVRNATHLLPEWKNRHGENDNSSVPFQPVDILTENGRQDMIPVYQEHFNNAVAMEGLSKTRFANRKFIRIAEKKLLEFL